MKDLKKQSVSVLMLSLVFLMSIAALLSPLRAQETYPREEVLYTFIDGGRVTVPDQFNPFIPGWVAAAGHNQIGIEYLFYYNYYSGELVPWLATGYDMSEDFKTMTLNLREGITWSDGEPFTAEDVEFTYNMLLTPHTPPLSYEGDAQATIESVEAVDATTVVFQFIEPNARAAFNSLFSVMIWGSVPIVPKHIWEGEDPTTFGFNPPVVTGPYGIKSYAETGDLYVWERRDDWWGTTVLGIRPEPKYVIYVAYATEEAIALEVAAGNLDVGGYITPGTFLSLRQTNPNVLAWYPDEPYAWDEVCPLFLPINTAKYPWNIREVRWALSYALDRTELNTISQEGTAPPYGNVFSPYMEPRFLDAVAEKEEQYEPLEYNPAKTEQIFTELGWTKGGDGVWVTDNGTRVEMEVFTHSGWLFIRKYGEHVADQFSRVGIDATAKLLTGSAYWDLWQTGGWDTAAMWMCAGVNEPYETLLWFHGKWVVPIGQIASSNHARWANATYDAIVDQMASMNPADPEYVTLFEDAMDIWYEEMPSLVTMHQPALIAYNSKYWTNWPTSGNPYIQPYYQCATWLFMVLNVKSAYVSPTTTVTETVTSTITTTTTQAAATVTETETVTALDMTTLAGAGIVALIVGVVVGWLVGSRRS